MIRLIKSVLHRLSGSKSLFHVYTDGSSKGKWGSWAFVIVQNQKILHESSGRVAKADSLIMEFQAAIEAINFLNKNSEAILYTDCRILIQVMRKMNKHTLRNKEQIDLLFDLLKERQVTWTWIKAHHGIIYNERCDQLCTEARGKK